MNDHEVLAPPGRDVALSGGRVVTVSPITLGQVPKFVKAIRPAFGALMALLPAEAGDSKGPGPAAATAGAGDGKDAAPAAADAGDSIGIDAFLDLVENHGPSLSSAIAICTPLKPAEVDALDLGEAFEVVKAVVEVNRDFFVHRVLPMLKR